VSNSGPRRAGQSVTLVSGGWPAAWAKREAFGPHDSPNIERSLSASTVDYGIGTVARFWLVERLAAFWT
jgi:hypothetical protein